MYDLIKDYVPADIADREFVRLWDGLQWDQRADAPRREYWQNDYDRPYTYGRGAGIRTYDARPWDDFVRETMLAINKEYGWRLDCCFINGYENARQALGWHSDDSPEMDPTQPVLSLSLGSERDIMVREIGSDTVERISLPNGSLFVMKAGMQQTHEHRIPKAGREVGPRISLTYRALVV